MGRSCRRCCCSWPVSCALYDPPRELAWQLFHDLKDAPKPGWLAPFLPHPAAVLYDDPIALILAAGATGLAAAYALLALAGAGPRARATLIAAGATLLVGLPTVGFIALGFATGRPYGHDGGVVQLPLALDRVLAGLSPYGADYSASVLGWQSRSSVFWAPLGGNPIVRHHWYLPGVHLAMAPFYVACRSLVRLLRSPPRDPGRLRYGHRPGDAPREDAREAPGGCGARGPEPLRLLAADLRNQRRDERRAAASRGDPRARVAGAMRRRSCSASPAPSSSSPGPSLRSCWRTSRASTSLGHIATRDGMIRLRRPASSSPAPSSPRSSCRSPRSIRRAFLGDIFRYQVGSPGSEQYPLGGTPGFGFANLLIYAGRVATPGRLLPVPAFLRPLRADRPPAAPLPARARAPWARSFVGGSAALLVLPLFLADREPELPHPGRPLPSRSAS